MQPIPHRALPLTSKIQTVVENVKKRRAVAYWLLIGVILFVVQVLLGGITRLTGSGLSITEWKPVLGAIPPLNDRDWQTAFEKYQQIAQYRYLNSHFTLSDFKAIYFWEWLHRDWGRISGLYIVAGTLIFWLRRRLDRRLLYQCLAIIVLTGLQGAIGWIMVASGLDDSELLYVSHIKLAIHFMVAMALVCYTFWVMLEQRIPGERLVIHPKLRSFTVVTTLLVCIQLVYGAFMAGLKAAPAAPTWPKINGEWVPSQVSQYGNRSFSGLSVLTDHPLMVHFVHRTLAYILFVILVIWFLRAAKAAREAAEDNALSDTRHWPLLLVLTQVILGIYTVISAPQMTPGHFGSFEILAQLHQLMAMFLLLALVANLYVIRSRPARQ